MEDWLAQRARATPGQEALVNAGSGNAWSYATLDETVQEMAGRLRALGVDETDHLGAVLETGVEAVCLIHAAMRLGTTLVPLAPDFTPPELSERFGHADVDAVICDMETEPTVREAVGSLDTQLSVLSIDDTDWNDVTALAAAEPAPITPASWEREDVQLLLFTSGTTGNAKAVQLTMGNLLASATTSGFRLGIDPEDRWLVPLSLHHMGGIAPVLRSTLYGTTAIIRESFDPGGTVDDIQRFGATCISLVPTMLRRMLSARGTLPDSLRLVLVGGAPCPEELVDRCRDFSVPICPTYGMTETASQIATARHREAYEVPDSVGRPLLWIDVTVVDEAGTPIGPGETGELVVSGPTVTPGYYADHAATGEAMGPHGLHTGDVGYQDEEGRLYVLNRLDDRILTGGENVDPGEVVDALREHPDVTDAAVVGLPDEEWGEEVAALVVPDGEEERPGIDELEPFFRDRLAGFKLPRTLGFTGELPRTVSGTVEREAVRERLTDGETVSIERTGTSGRAATETEGGRSGIQEAGHGEHPAESPAEAEESRPDGEPLEASSQEAETDAEPAGPDESAESAEIDGTDSTVTERDSDERRKGMAALSMDVNSGSEEGSDTVESGPGAALGTERGAGHEDEDLQIPTEDDAEGVDGVLSESSAEQEDEGDESTDDEGSAADDDPAADDDSTDGDNAATGYDGATRDDTAARDDA